MLAERIRQKNDELCELQRQLPRPHDKLPVDRVVGVALGEEAELRGEAPESRHRRPLPVQAAVDYQA